MWQNVVASTNANVLSHSFYELGIRGEVSWVPYPGSHQAEIGVSHSSCLIWAQGDLPNSLVVGRILFFTELNSHLIALWGRGPLSPPGETTTFRILPCKPLHGILQRGCCSSVLVGECPLPLVSLICRPIKANLPFAKLKTSLLGIWILSLKALSTLPYIVS